MPRGPEDICRLQGAKGPTHILGATLVVGDKERKVDNQPNATDGLFVPQRLVICLSFRSHESLPPSHPRVIEDCGPRGLTLGGKEFTDRREKWRETLTRRMDANAQQESIRLTSLSLPLVARAHPWDHHTLAKIGTKVDPACGLGPKVYSSARTPTHRRSTSVTIHTSLRSDTHKSASEKRK